MKVKIFSSAAILFFVVSIFSLYLATGSFAAEARCSLVKVSGKGMKLTEVVSGDLKEVLVIQLLNDIQNPYELKEGLKIMVPEKEFIAKVKNLSYSELTKEVGGYHESISKKTLKEVAESVNGPEKLDEKKADEHEFKYNSLSTTMKQMQGEKPVEVERIEFPRKFKHN